MDIQINTQCQFGDQIRQFIVSQFPAATTVGHEDLIDILSQLVLGNNKQRQGPNPSPESIVEIRKVIRNAVTANKPIPFMVPWGSVKPDGSSIDVAELSTFRTFERLHRSVQELYRPGVQMGVRLEDISMPYFLFDGEETREKREEELSVAARYTGDFKAAVRILGLEEIIVVRPESEFVTIDKFSEKAGEFLPFITEALKLYNNGAPTQARELLDSIGWKSGMSHELREYYLGLYTNLYPDASPEEHEKRMARYFASAMARSPLNLRGDLPEWEGEFIDFALAQPVPGTKSLFPRRVYRRAVSKSMSGRHVAPWRAKGYLVMQEDDSVSVKLRSYRQAPKDLTEEIVTLKGDNPSDVVHVRADWICE